MTRTKKILSAVLISVGVFAGFVIWANWSFFGLTKDTFSLNYGTEEEIFSFDTDRDFHGDGFSIKVEKLDKKSQEYFKNPPIEFYDLYPKRHYHLGDFEIYKWTKTPANQVDIYKTDFATKPDEEFKSWKFPDKKNKDIDEYLNYTDSLLKTEGNYFAMFFRDHPYQLYGIDLFVISPTEGILIKINRQ